MTLLQKLGRYKAFRYAAYLVAFALWLPTALRDASRAARCDWSVSWADFSLTVEGSERTQARAKAQAGFKFAETRPMPTNTSDTIKMPYYLPYRRVGISMQAQRWTADVIADAASKARDQSRASGMVTTC